MSQLIEGKTESEWYRIAIKYLYSGNFSNGNRMLPESGQDRATI